MTYSNEGKAERKRRQIGDPAPTPRPPAAFISSMLLGNGFRTRGVGLNRPALAGCEATLDCERACAYCLMCQKCVRVRTRRSACRCAPLPVCHRARRAAENYTAPRNR
ncbi:hypothetical protein EYF80_014559 [Liparis tanakae]|uniref:Uncharacterized protein n=1 Tax=Liparis tanakae TaxID=230148 RepID=A0A4Z2IAQ4_9TELE|nr:hypothetical protein EYF80_014559 [Liparis tanakae]